MKTLITTLVLVLSTGMATAQTTTYQDAMGRNVGRAVTNNAGTVYYDNMGRNTGRSTTNSTGTTYYNSMGQQTGRSRSSGRSR